MKHDETNFNENRLVYREHYHPWLGVIIALPGIALVVITTFDLVQRLPFDIERNLAQLLGSCVAAVGLALLSGKHIALDRQRRAIIRTSGWAFLRRSTTEPIGELKSVTWSPAVSKGKFDLHIATAEAKTLLFQVDTESRAGQFAGQIATFFGIDEGTWQRERLASKNTGIAANPLARGVIALMRGSSLWRVVKTETQFTYIKTCDALCKVFALMAAPMGVVALLYYGLKDARKEDDQALLFIGPIFILIAIVLFFARWGFTIDTRGAYASTWWGLWVPFRKKSRELPRFSTVAFERTADTINNQPVVLGRVVLVGNNGDSFVLWTSTEEADAKWLASEVAEFLKYPIVERTAEPTLDAPA
jgi:hypothetical protein